MFVLLIMNHDKEFQKAFLPIIKGKALKYNVNFSVFEILRVSYKKRSLDFMEDLTLSLPPLQLLPEYISGRTHRSQWLAA